MFNTEKEYYCEHKNIVFALDNKNEWYCADCRKSNPQRPTREEIMGEERDRAYEELRKGAEQFNALEREFFALEDKFLTACRLLNKYGGFPALEELLKYSPAKQREADDREEDDEGSPEKGCGGECCKDGDSDIPRPGGRPWSRF